MKRLFRTAIVAGLLISGLWHPADARAKSWIVIRSPHFTVYSDADERKALRVTHEFEKFRALIRSFLPSLKVDPAIPTIVLAANDERTLRSLLPQFWGKSGQAHPSGIFVGGAEKNYVALRLDMDDDYRYHVVYHEYVHLLMRLNYPPLPVWLNEGLAECFGYTVISDGSSVIGRTSPVLLDILNNEPLLPLADLFAVDRESPYYREESKTPIFYAQSWALTHMLLLGDRRANAPMLLKFLDLLQKNVPAGEAAAQAFGDTKELERRLHEYILQVGFYSFEVKTPSVQDPGEYLVRAIPPLEMRAVEGDFFVSTELWDAAKERLDSVLERDPGNADALTSLGIYYERKNHLAEAEKLFVRAASAGSKSCITHYHAGYVAYRSGDYEQAEKSFRQAIALNPNFALAYSGLASILAMREDTAASALEYALKALVLEPGVLAHRLVLANALLRLKKTDMAIRYAEQVESGAESDRDREEARRFLSRARRYRDNSEEIEKMKEAIGQRPQLPPVQKEMSGVQPGRDEARQQQREAIEKALAAQERKEQSILRERSDAYEERRRIEQEYGEIVEANRAAETSSMEGTVTEVRCYDPAAMELTVEAEGSPHTLHIANYYKIRFAAIDHDPAGALKPCSDLVGRQVRLEYIATPGATYAGEIQSLGIFQ